MYEIYADGNLLYDDQIENLKVFAPKLTLELNKTGDFSFTIHTNHPYYGTILKLKTIVTVYQDDYLIFRGRVLNIEEGFYNQRSVKCEGELAFLLDSIKRPYEFTGSVRDYIKLLIDNHNSQVLEPQQFVLGNVTVTDPNNTIVRSNIDYVNTWDEINKKLIEELGGYISVRHENGVNYIDYLEDFNLLSPQKVEFAKNLLDLKMHKKGEEIYTGIIPLGAKVKDAEGNDTDERLTIATVNNGLDYLVDEEAIALHNTRNFKIQIWDDVTLASNLLTKGRAALGTLKESKPTIELTAADMATANKDITSFHLGTYVQVISNPHGIDQTFLIYKLSIDLFNPAANKLTLGGTVESFTSQTDKVLGSIPSIKDGKDGEKGEKGDDGKDAAIQSPTAPKDTSFMWLDTSIEPPVLKRYNPNTQVWEIINDTTSLYESIVILEEHTYSEIARTEESILTTVAEQYYLADDAEKLASNMSTQIEQTASDFTIRFDQFNADLESLSNGTDAEFEQIRKYIRFVDGKILLGEVGNELELQIANDRISFQQNGAEVAYFSNNKLYVVDGEFTNSLRLGNFAFIPRANGNLSFKRA